MMEIDHGNIRHSGVLLVFFVFAACFRVATSQCSGTTLIYTATDAYQVFTSVNYPAGYNNNEDCIWRIEADNVTDVVRMKITDADIEYHANCVYDYGEVFDGYNTTADSMGKFCGTETPTYITSANYLTVTFHSDYSLSSKGFKARYKSGPRASLVDKEEKKDQVNMLVIVCASLGGVVFIVVVVTLVYTYIQAKKAKDLRRHPHMRRGMVRVEPFVYGGWSYLDGPAPPAYGEIYSSPMSPPPQYSETDPNPNPLAPLPGRREFMGENEETVRQNTDNTEERRASERTDNNANTHFVVTNSLRGYVTQINNYTSNNRTQSHNSTPVVRGNTVQNLNPLAVTSIYNEAGITTSFNSASTTNQTVSLPNAVAPLSTESTNQNTANINSSSDHQSTNVVSCSRSVDNTHTVSSLGQQNNRVTSACQLEADERETSGIPNVIPDQESTCSSVSEMSLPSTRSVTMISDSVVRQPTQVSS